MILSTPSLSGPIDKEVRPGCGVKIRTTGIMLTTVEVRSVDDAAQSITLSNGTTIRAAQVIDVIEPGDLVVEQGYKEWTTDL